MLICLIHFNFSLIEHQTGWAVPFQWYSQIRVFPHKIHKTLTIYKLKTPNNRTLGKSRQFISAGGKSVSSWTKWYSFVDTFFSFISIISGESLEVTVNYHLFFELTWFLISFCYWVFRRLDEFWVLQFGLSTYWNEKYHDWSFLWFWYWTTVEYDKKVGLSLMDLVYDMGLFYDGLCCKMYQIYA